MAKITLTEYFGPYYGHPDITADIRKNAESLLESVNGLIDDAEATGFKFRENPNTGTSIHNRSEISGENNGGFRPQACPIGAPKSKHKTGQGLDIFDPGAKFAAWCYSHRDALKDRGLTMERHEWTPTWVHLQNVPPGHAGSPWRLDFVPDASPPKVAALPEQGTT